MSGKNEGGEIGRRNFLKLSAAGTVGLALEEAVAAVGAAGDKKNKTPWEKELKHGATQEVMLTNGEHRQLLEASNETVLAIPELIKKLDEKRNRTGVEVGVLSSGDNIVGYLSEDNPIKFGEEQQYLLQGKGKSSLVIINCYNNKESSYSGPVVKEVRITSHVCNNKDISIGYMEITVDATTGNVKQVSIRENNDFSAPNHTNKTLAYQHTNVVLDYRGKTLVVNDQALIDNQKIPSAQEFLGESVSQEELQKTVNQVLKNITVDNKAR